MEVLRWDSRFFGRKMARLKSRRLTSRTVQAALKACERKRVDCLYFLASANDSSSIACAQTHGFRLVDIRVTLVRDLTPSKYFLSAPRAGPTTYRSARPSDIRSLKPIATTVFPYSRFTEDPRFPRGAHQKLYATWVAKSVRGDFDDWVGVAERRGRLMGFVSCRRTGRAGGAIGLIGVARAFQGQGIGRGLLNHAFHWLLAHHIRHISVATQGCAVEAQRFYQDAGFRTSQVDLWFHKWF